MLKTIFEELKRDWPALLILALAFIARMLYIFAFTEPQNYLFSDPGGYDARALEMAKGGKVLFSTYFPPLFHIFLSFVYRPLIWLGVESWRVAIDVFIFSALSILSFWFIFKISEKLFSEKTALIILAALCLWHPLVYINYLVMSENIFIPLFFWGLYLLITKPHKPVMGLWVGVAWGIALLARPVLALFFPLFLIWGIKYKISWKFLSGFTSALLILIFSMMAFNFYYTAGAERSVSSNGGVGFAMLWCDAKSIQMNNNGMYYWFAPPARENYPENARIYTTEPFENQKYYYKMGLQCLAENHSRLFTVGPASVAALFHSQLFPTIPEIFLWEELRLVFKIITGILFVMATVSLIAIRLGKIKIFHKDKKYFYLFGLVIFSLFITVYFQNPGEERYLIPYSPLLILMSTPGFLKLSNLIFKPQKSDNSLKNNL